MPTNDTVVSIPFVAGLNQQLDPDQLQPPELIQAENVVARRGGRLEKRSGYHLVGTVDGSGTPANAFGGSSSVVDGSVEAIGPYYGKDGTRAILASGSKFYEHVGSDADHGWREVNRLPTYLGMLHSVSAVGGSVIEVESILVEGESKRLTVWITGTRTGQELTSDRTYVDQTSGDGNSVYYAIQEVETGAFLKPPTRMRNAAGAYVTSATNLRVTTITNGTDVYPLVAWEKNGIDVEYCLVYTNSGLTSSTVSPFIYTVNKVHRGFDVVGLPQSTALQAVFSFTRPDTASNTTTASLVAIAVTINPLTAIPTTVSTVADMLVHTAPASGAWFNPWAQRGIVLQQDIEYDASIPGWSIAFGARVISRYYSAPASPQQQISGQVILGRLRFRSDTSALSTQTTQAYLPSIGFQTQDDHTSVLAWGSSSGTEYKTGGTTVLQPLGTSLLTTTALPSQSGANSAIVITGTLPDTTTQVYEAQIGQNFTGNGVTTTTYYSMSPSGPYLAHDKPNIAVSGSYPSPTHFYAQDTAQTIGLTGSQLNQVNQIQIDSASTNKLFDVGIHTGVQFQVAGVTICTATVYVDPDPTSPTHQHIIEVAIENGLPGYSGWAGPGSVVITGVVGAGAGGTLTGAKAWNYTLAPRQSLSAKDVPSRAQYIAQSRYFGPRCLEHCVHRWSVSQLSDVVVLALSSAAGVVSTTPNGAEPFGAADPHAQNSFFEVYKWTATGPGGALTSATGGTTSPLVSALGGPWRLVAGMAKVGSSLLCAVSPAGDVMQRSTFLVRIGSTAQSASITTPDVSKTRQDNSAEFVTYGDNIGMFVESCNMMRVTAPPLNVPKLNITTAGLTCGALRDGSSKGTQEVFAIEYDGNPSSWRQIRAMSDYAFVNGGVLSVFDGVGCNEATSLLWPQRDFTSIAWPDTDPAVFIPSPQNAGSTVLRDRASTFFNNGAYNGSTSPATFMVTNVSRPWFKYEAGLNDARGVDAPVAWSTIQTYWGGDPAKSYETVYSDPRISQFSNAAQSFSSGLTGSGSIAQHYYGRYQAHPALYGGAHQPLLLQDLAYWVWAPRSAAGWGDEIYSNYDPTDAAGDFLMRWTYEYSDGTGRMVRSAPSQAMQFTVCAEILGAPHNEGASPAYFGGLVSEFRYGFFAPRLELTNRLATASSDARRVVLQPYTTAEPFSTVMYRMPFSNFLNATSDFVVGRNESRGTVPYSGSPGYGALGLVTRNFSCFDGPNKEYNGILSQPYLYTTGSVLDNVAPPSAKVMCVHQNRLVVGGADDATVIWISKELTPTDAPGFNEALTLTISDSGAVTGLASLNGNLVVFKQNAIFVVPGVLPDATGYAPSMGEPIKLPAGVGCIEPRSVVETPVGVFFMSERGLEILYPTLQVEQIGQKVRETLTQYPVMLSAIHHPNDQEARFLVAMADRADETLICYSYQFNVWSTHKIGYIGNSPMQMATIDGIPWIAARTPWNSIGGGVAYRQSPVSALDLLPDSTGGSAPNVNYVKMTVATAPIDVHQVQGFQRVKRARLLMTNNVHPEQTADLLPGVIMFGLTDYNASFTLGGAQVSTWTAAEVQSVLTTQGRVQVEMHLREQKGQAIQVAYVEGDPATTPVYTDHGWGLAISNIALVVGLKKNLDKRILPDAKH